MSVNNTTKEVSFLVELPQETFISQCDYKVASLKVKTNASAKQIIYSDHISCPNVPKKLSFDLFNFIPIITLKENSICSEKEHHFKNFKENSSSKKNSEIDSKITKYFNSVKTKKEENNDIEYSLSDISFLSLEEIKSEEDISC
jgi:hypothetical protein